MSLQDLYQAMNMFSESVTKYGVSRGIADANNAVQQLHASEMDDMQKRAALSQISNQLTSQLAGLGAPATTIAAAAGAVAPAPIKDSVDAVVQGTKTGSLTDLAGKMQEAEFDKTKRQINLSGQWDMKKQALANEAIIAKQKRTIDVQDMKGLDALSKNFNSNAKKYLEGVEQARTAKSILESGNPIGDTAVATFMARATGEVGNLTEEERKPYGSAQDLTSRFSQALKQYKDGKLTDDNRMFLRDLADTFEKRNQAAARSFADRMSKQYGKVHGKDPEMIRGYILPEDEGQAPAQGQQAPKQAAPQGQVKTYKRKDGTTFRGIKQPDGRIQVVE